MKKPEFIVKEYVGRLSDDNLNFLEIRLTERYSGDMSEATELLARSSELDKWLSTAKSGDEFFDMLDLITDCVDSEAKKRSIRERERRSAK